MGRASRCGARGASLGGIDGVVLLIRLFLYCAGDIAMTWAFLRGSGVINWLGNGFGAGGLGMDWSEGWVGLPTITAGFVHEEFHILLQSEGVEKIVTPARQGRKERGPEHCPYRNMPRVRYGGSAKATSILFLTLTLSMIGISPVQRVFRYTQGSGARCVGHASLHGLVADWHAFGLPDE